jgi:hypothetical protein
MNRRRMLFGLAAVTTLSACAGRSEKELVAYDRVFLTQNDPLASLRLHADADPATWARHLDLPRLKNKPQILALSGGGEDGAFGAGALNGWSESGTRPDFDIVTGVSTGALIAPLAFAGQEYDDNLRHMFLDHDASDIMRFRGLAAATGDSLYDTTPLAELIETYTPDAFLRVVAAKHDAGGRLFVVTSDLATSTAVVWNMGAIAKAGQYELMRTVILASGALPGLFSPVKVSYEVGDQGVTETHVDGGVQMQLLAAPEAAFGFAGQHAAGGHGYVIVNNTLEPDPEDTAGSVLGVTQQAMTAMVRASAAASVNTARLLAGAHGIGFSMASVEVDSGAVYDPSDRFSAKYMRKLYEYGYDRAVSSRLWQA